MSRTVEITSPHSIHVWHFLPSGTRAGYALYAEKERKKKKGGETKRDEKQGKTVSTFCIPDHLASAASSQSHLVSSSRSAGGLSCTMGPSRFFDVVESIRVRAGCWCGCQASGDVMPHMQLRVRQAQAQAQAQGVAFPLVTIPTQAGRQAGLVGVSKLEARRGLRSSSAPFPPHLAQSVLFVSVPTFTCHITHTPAPAPALNWSIHHAYACLLQSTLNFSFGAVPAGDVARGPVSS